MQELRKYDESLFHKPRWLVLNKIDLVPGAKSGSAACPVPSSSAMMRSVSDHAEQPRVFAISALTGEGCRELDLRRGTVSGGRLHALQQTAAARPTPTAAEDE